MEEHKINCATNDNNYQHLGCTCGADNINALAEKESNSGRVVGYKFWGGELNMPTCNHCGYEFKDEEVFEGSGFDTSDGGDTEKFCPKCDKKIFARAYHKLCFVMLDEDGDEL